MESSCEWNSTKTNVNNKNDIQLVTNALHNAFEFENPYASYTTWQNSANSVYICASLFETIFQVEALMLAVRFHGPFPTLYDNQINYIFMYLRHDATWGLRAKAPPPTFSEIKLFRPSFILFLK